MVAHRRVLVEVMPDQAKEALKKRVVPWDVVLGVPDKST